MDKKLSVIITVYNTSKFLQEGLNSVINQTYKNLEIIVLLIMKKILDYFVHV